MHGSSTLVRTTAASQLEDGSGELVVIKTNFLQPRELSNFWWNAVDQLVAVDVEHS